MIIKRELECVDEQRSDFDVWEENGEIRPDKAGQVKTFYKLIVDPRLIQEEDIFRVKNYNVAVIISERLKREFEANDVKGPKYQPVS
jgi:hypothetical protein